MGKKLLCIGIALGAIAWLVVSLGGGQAGDRPTPESGSENRADELVPERLSWEKPERWIDQTRDEATTVEIHPAAGSTGDDAMELETLGPLPPDAMRFAQEMLIGLHESSLKRLEEFQINGALDTPESASAEARLLASCELSLVAPIALAAGDYLVVKSKMGPLPLATEGDVEKMAFGAGLRDERATVMLVIDRQKYPALLAARRNQERMRLAELASRAAAFNLQAYGVRRELITLLGAMRRGETIAPADKRRLRREIPHGTLADEDSFTLSVRR